MRKYKKVNALVPMKAHSERVKEKNIRSFAGKPLFHWVIETLLNSEYIEDIYIDTDSEKIRADCKESFNLEIIKRPMHLCGDYISMNDIIAYDIAHINGDYFLQTHATNPLLKTNTINRAIETFFKLKEFDSLFSVTKLQTRLYDANCKPTNHNLNELLPTQDLRPIFEENSNIYIFSRQSFTKAGSRRIGMQPFMFEMNKIEAIDIDTEDDFRVAEAIKLSQEN